MFKIPVAHFATDPGPEPEGKGLGGEGRGRGKGGRVRGGRGEGGGRGGVGGEMRWRFPESSEPSWGRSNSVASFGLKANPASYLL